MKVTKILLTTDFSELSEGAFRPAASLARRVGAAVDLVHVSEFPPAVGAAFTEVSWERCLGSYRQRLEEMAGDPAFTGLQVAAHLLEGYGPETLRLFREEGGHDLIVMATHGHTGLRHLFLGSFTEKVLRTASCPVLALKHREDGGDFQARRILYPTDLSATSRAATRAVRFFVDLYGSEVLAFHVIPHDVIPVAAFGEEAVVGSALPVFWEETRKHCERELAALVAAELADCQASFATDRGSPAVEISRKAEEWKADLIVMATHGHTGLRHMLMGSIAERVVRKAHCSTVTVRPGNLQG